MQLYYKYMYIVRTRLMSGGNVQENVPGEMFGLQMSLECPGECPRPDVKYDVPPIGNREPFFELQCRLTVCKR